MFFINRLQDAKDFRLLAITKARASGTVPLSYPMVKKDSLEYKSLKWTAKVKAQEYQSSAFAENGFHVCRMVSPPWLIALRVPPRNPWRGCFNSQLATTEKDEAAFFYHTQ